MKGKLPMLSLIEQEGVVCGPWKLLTLAENEFAETVSLPVGPLLVPVAVWHARRRELVEREYAHGWPLGVWLAAGESPRAIADDLDDFSIVAIHFPKTTDGRGCFAARLLRRRYGYRGELRAFGEVLHEQLFYLRRSGFDAFALRADQAARAPNAGLDDCDKAHQAASRQPLRLVPRCPASELPCFDTTRAT
jgi:uncharacterized protein (DUF934 family)